ncbi:hypothetical protein [Clostridium tagluense]|uniref:hypothetical protein n=1 Tax=Clostridium tagluense TaxID=360422 RepID=UPI001C0D29BF|nr:hypothetical protein [Clostridium tagluense]MBU3128646.1 hypothetical protein [Clostridium tagluense]MBW9158575.1 hypothetical protein [Clostridium tagluense]WLC63690.1 hypothetical protein KTC93_12415 [Clostridium tagluense]
MNNKRWSNISFIGGFYIFGAIVLLVTLITGVYKTDTGGLSMALRHGLLFFPELPARIILIIISLIIGVGLLKLNKWAYRLVLYFCLYFTIANIIMALNTGNNGFYSNIIFSIWVLFTLPKDRRVFD